MCLYSKSGVGKLSIKDKIVNIFGFVGFKVSMKPLKSTIMTHKQQYTRNKVVFQ